MGFPFSLVLLISTLSISTIDVWVFMLAVRSIVWAGLRNRERQRKDALLRNRGILAGAQQRLMGNGPRASADGSSTAGDPSQIGTRSVKQHLPSCDKVTDRSIPCVPGIHKREGT